MASLNHHPALRQSAALSPRFQHAVRLLQLSSFDFALTVRDVLGKNPFLEAEDGAGDVRDGGSAAADEGGDQATTGSAETDGSAMPSYTDGLSDGDSDPGSSTGSDSDTDTGEMRDTARGESAEQHDGDGDSDRDLWLADGLSPSRQAGHGEATALDLMAVDVPLNAHLNAQLDAQVLDTRARWLARVIVESLDDDGYLRTPLADLCALADLDPPADLADMQSALRAVQALDPIGVAACSVGECLRLQLPVIECPQLRALAERIVEAHLGALAARDTAALARALGVSLLRAQQACDRIRHLDPRPGWRLGSTRVAYVVPDVVAKKIRGVWRVQLNPAVVPRVRLNQVYADLFKRHRRADNADMALHLQEARWTVKNVEQRFSTILDVAEAIVERQQHFLEFGPMAMKPLGLREIAEQVGIHESTVSRVTNNKFIATPCGVFELKYFFSRVMVSANGSACSGTAIRGLLKDMIDAESADAPLSDVEITRQMAQQGLTVARRTVTKYRQQLRIDAVERRRRHA